jgi:hypothetical protein
MPLACILGCGQPASTEASSQPEPKTAVREIRTQDVESVVRVVVAHELRVDSQLLDINKPIEDQLALIQIVMTLEEVFVVEIPERVIVKYGGADLGDSKCKLTPSQLVAIVRESKELAAKK